MQWAARNLALMPCETPKTWSLGSIVQSNNQLDFYTSRFLCLTTQYPFVLLLHWYYAGEGMLYLKTKQLCSQP